MIVSIAPILPDNGVLKLFFNVNMSVAADDNYQWLFLNRTMVIVCVFYDMQCLNVLLTLKTVPRSRTMLCVCDNTGFYQWEQLSYKHCFHIFRESQVSLWLCNPSVRAVMHSGKHVFCAYYLCTLIVFIWVL
jgi:hypothetical protein